MNSGTDETLATLQAEMEQLRATLAEQQEVIGKQQAAIAALQQPVAAEHETTTASATAAPAQTSRRGFLGAAALGAAAATVAAVAVNGGQEAHAAPNTVGGNVVLGSNNDSNATTEFSVTGGASLPGSLVYVYNPTANGTALDGQSYGGTGAYGHDGNNGYGVYGASAGGSGVGIFGLATGAASAATVAATDSGIGVLAFSTSGLDIASAGTGRIFQAPEVQAGPPANPNGTYFYMGESIRDANGILWLCVAATVSSGGVVSTPAKWAKVGSVVPGLTGGATTYLAHPIRLLDTRPGATNTVFAPGVKYSGTHSLQVSGDVSGSVTVPAGIAGAIGNVTVLNESGSGYLALVPSGAGFSGTANLAFSPGQIVSNSYNVGLSVGGALDIIIGNGASTDVIVDLFAVVI